MTMCVFSLVLAAVLVPGHLAVEDPAVFADVFGSCSKEVSGEVKGVVGVDFVVASATTSFDCREKCENYQTTDSKRCYGIQHDVEPEVGIKSIGECKIWTEPILGRMKDTTKVCMIPFGEVIAMQMVFTGIGSFGGLISLVDNKIEEIMKKKIADENTGVPESHVSVNSDMANSVITGRFVLPAGVPHEPVLVKAQELGPKLESAITGNSIVSGAFPSMKLDGYEAWVWGNATADAENEVNGASGSLPAMFLMMLLGLTVFSAIV